MFETFSRNEWRASKFAVFFLLRPDGFRPKNLLIERVYKLMDELQAFSLQGKNELADCQAQNDFFLN